MVTFREKVVRAKGVTSSIDTDGGGTIRALTGAETVLAVSQADAGFTPLEMLDGALAGCLAVSIRYAAKQHGWLERLGEISVTVAHHKAADAPSRAASFEAYYKFGGDLSKDEKQVLIEEAHRLCTVGNTLTHGASIDDL